uniref:(northern house mosquito) hypothetical protein n=1 Tax=Culex pipiens TaxID=7175 RepID=A0A8D8DUM4_CULPI
MVATGMFLGTKWWRRDRQFPHRNGVELRSSGVTIAVGDTAGVVWVTRASGTQGWACRPVREAYTPRGLVVQFLRRFSCSSSGSSDRRTLFFRSSAPVPLHSNLTANVTGSTVHFLNHQASDRSNGADSPAILNLIHPSRFAPFSSYFALANPLSFSWRFLVVTSATTPACSVGSVHWRWTATRVGMFRSPAFTGFPFGMLIYASRNNSLTTLEANLTTGYTLPSLG